jgi:hypothetical protein
VLDLVFVALTLAFFSLAVLLLRGLEWILASEPGNGRR